MKLDRLFYTYVEQREKNGKQTQERFPPAFLGKVTFSKLCWSHMVFVTSIPLTLFIIQFFKNVNHPQLQGYI